jgi:hypothetical protein
VPLDQCFPTTVPQNIIGVLPELMQQKHTNFKTPQKIPNIPPNIVGIFV